MPYRVTLDDLADACRKSGLRVVEIPGWREFGRPSGGFDPQAAQCHHTGSKDTNPHSITDDRAYAEWLAKIGRSDLPAPLCQLALDRTSTVYVCAAGRGNHAGTAKAHGGLPAGDGNALRLGIEAHNSGTEGWDHPGTDAAGNPVTQYEGFVRLCAALHLHYGWDVDALAAHWEVSVTGKWDPGDPYGPRLGSNRVMDMDRFRADVARVISEMEDDMASPEVQAQLDRMEKLLTKLDERGKNEVTRDRGAFKREANQMAELRRLAAEIVAQGEASREEVLAAVRDEQDA